VAVAYQTNCDRCGAELVPQAAYCERCEILFVLLVIAMIFAFAYIFYNQK
jgi:hypothetical protein